MSNRIIMAIIVILSLVKVNAQPCSPEALMQIPGIWKKGMQGSIHNVTAENLAKEKAMLAEIHKMTGSYQPYGLEVHHSTVFGYNIYGGKKWLADPYYFNAYFMEFLCDHSDNDIKKKWVNPHTNTTAIVYVNRISPFSDGQGADIPPATYPDDRHEPFHRIISWPQQKDGYWYWLIQDSVNERSTMKKYYYLITYDGQLPFTGFTRKEYLEYQLPRMKKFLAEQIKLVAELDPASYDEKSFRELKVAGEERANEYRKKIKDTEELLVTMSAAELNKIAIVKNDGQGEFYGFFKEGEPYTSLLIKPNPAYYKPLPKWVPQFFCIAISQSTTAPVFRQAIPAFEKTLDFAWFRSKLGNTSLTPTQQTIKNTAASGPSSSPSTNTTAGTGKTNTAANAAANQATAQNKNTNNPSANSTKPAAAQNKNTAAAPASTSPSNIFDPSKPVYDLDSNQYTVIKIGNRYWLKENLRTTQYNDTTPIVTGLNDAQWKQTKAGAYAIYENNPLNGKLYGKLYNGYAVVSGKLCPKGWRIPTDKEWNEMELSLGVPAAELERTGERGAIAPKLKTKEGWKQSSFTGDNSSGFTILPAGSRLDNGEFTTLGQYGNFWTSTVYDDRYGLLYLWNHHVHYNTNAVGRIYTLANNGYSCRCIQDNSTEKKTSKPATKKQ